MVTRFCQQCGAGLRRHQDDAAKPCPHCGGVHLGLNPKKREWKVTEEDRSLMQWAKIKED